jgi:hypothetical protein
MARLFIGPREQQLISDLTKEFTKDILGQYITYFPVSPIYTKVHPVYEEAVEKVFENPIKIDVLAGQPNNSLTWNSFGSETKSEIELYVQPRDLLDKGIDVESGDFFLYGDSVYEVLNAYTIENIYGQPEYDRAKIIKGKLARSGQFDLDTFKRLLQDSEKYSDSQIVKAFVQQRGLKENSEGVTNDKRQIRERLGEDMAPIALNEGPRQIAPDEDDDLGNKNDIATDSKSSRFYDE